MNHDRRPDADADLDELRAALSHQLLADAQRQANRAAGAVTVLLVVGSVLLICAGLVYAGT